MASTCKLLLKYHKLEDILSRTSLLWQSKLPPSSVFQSLYCIGTPNPTCLHSCMAEIIRLDNYEAIQVIKMSTLISVAAHINVAFVTFKMSCGDL